MFPSPSGSRSALDKSTLKLSLFGKKGFDTGYISKEDPYHAIISKYVEVDNLDLTFNISNSSEYNKDTLYSIIFNNDAAKTAFKNKQLGNGNFQRLNYVKNSKVVDSYPNTGTLFIYNVNGEAVPELTSEYTRFEYDPKFGGYKMGKAVALKAEPGNKHLYLFPYIFYHKADRSGDSVNFIVIDLSKGDAKFQREFPAGLKPPSGKVLNAKRLDKDELGIDFYRIPHGTGFLQLVDKNTIKLVDEPTDFRTP